MRPFVVHGDPERLRDLVDLPELSSVEAELAIPRGALHAMTRKDGRTLEEVPTSPEDALGRLAAGATLRFVALRSPKLSKWARALERDCRLPPSTVFIHSFACGASPDRLPIHCDPASFFVVQLRGRKRWRLAPNEHVRFPDKLVERREDSMPADHSVVEMERGSVLFVPRGYWHHAEVAGTESVHLTIGTRRPTWADLLHFALRITHALDTLPWREDAPDLFENGVFRAEVVAELSSRLPGLLRTIEEQAGAADADDIARACASIGFR
jgi:ribosomal protein L16 Arg81 hydroxylase